MNKKTIRENIVIKGFIEKCPKCPYLMARKTRKEVLPYMLEQRGYFTEWDYCDRCKHVQHYQKYRIENPN